MRLHLAGHLAWYESQKRSRVEISAPRSTLLIDLLRDLGIPLGEIAIAVVNGVAVEPQTARVSDTDRVDLFPPVGGGEVLRLSFRAPSHAKGRRLSTEVSR